MYLLFALACLCIEWHIPPLIPSLPLITYHNQIIILILCLFSFKHACHANPGNDKK